MNDAKKWSWPAVPMPTLVVIVLVSIPMIGAAAQPDEVSVAGAALPAVSAAGEGPAIGEAGQEPASGRSGQDPATGESGQDPASAGAGQDPASRLQQFTEQKADEEEAEAGDDATTEGTDPTNFDTAQLPTRATLGALERLQILSPETATSYLTALKAQYDYKTVGFDHRRKVFAWQYYSSIIIFGMVVTLVSMGFYFSWVQFRRDIVGPPTDAEATELELSTQGVKVQSSVLGVIILVVSLAFLYLYLVYVYPIQEIL